MQHYQRWSQQISTSQCAQSRTSFKITSHSINCYKNSIRNCRMSINRSQATVSKLRNSLHSCKQRIRCYECNLNSARPCWKQFRRGRKSLNMKMTLTLPINHCCRMSRNHCARRTNNSKKIYSGLQTKLNLTRTKPTKLSKTFKPITRSWGVWSVNWPRSKLQRSN
jgi:hypothetical protein